MRSRRRLALSDSSHSGGGNLGADGCRAVHDRVAVGHHRSAMDADKSRPVRRRPAVAAKRAPVRRPRELARPDLDAGPQQQVRDLLHDLHKEAGMPSLEDLAKRISSDDRLDGAPKKDLIHRITSQGGPAGLDDVRAVARTLARACGKDEYTIAAQITQLISSSERPVPPGALLSARSAYPAPPVPDRLGRLVGNCDPLALEVHPAIQVPGTEPAAVLPVYVPRVHDGRLHEIVDGMLADKRSRLVTMVGESSAGKTRTGWELVQYLDAKSRASGGCGIRSIRPVRRRRWPGWKRSARARSSG